MEESRKTDSPDKPRRVRVPWFPTYGELRGVLNVWKGRPQRQVTELERRLARLRGTPKNPVDWRDPDTWIPEKLSGDERELARAVWVESGKTVNPRHTAGHWILSQKYELLVDGSDGNLKLTDRGRDFIQHEFGKAEAFLDGAEGLVELLDIVASVGPARLADFIEPWAEFLGRHSQFGSPSTIRDTLQRRLKNLLDRSLLNREGRSYAVTNAGLDYLKTAGMADRTSSVPAGIKRYADDDDGQKIFGALADSIEFANALNRECWATIILTTGHMGFYVGLSTMMLLHPSAKRVEINLLPKLLEKDLRDRLRPAPHGQNYKFAEGARRYLLDWKDFVEQWPLMREAHREVIKQAVQKTNRSSEHCIDAINFLDRTLGRELPQPGYLDNDSSSTTRRPAEKKRGFWALTASLRDEDLLFSRELVANYVLALQTKRFAILTGISGTGKTKIAKAVAQHFTPLQERGIVARVPDDAVGVEVKPADNYVVVPVRPDWVDNRGLLGYLNPLTGQYSTTPFLDLLLRAREEEKRAKAAGEESHPFFVILDEMNLARVEHYFSDFLSALESGEEIPLHEDEDVENGESQSGTQIPRRLKIPGNVLFTGTVNVDETTYMFSPKVLDRAFTIEFDRVDLEGFTKGETSEDTAGLTPDADNSALDLLPSSSSENDDWKPTRADWVKFSKETGGHQKALLQLHRILEAQHRHFGYRVANEIARFVNLAREQAADTNAAADTAFDLALLQKVLPKFHGTQQELESLLEEIFHFAVHGGSHPSKQRQTVETDDWEVVGGRLRAKSQAKATPVEPSSEADAPDSADASVPDAGTQSPAYPRTGAKVLRMLQRLRDRGFTSFIE